MSGAPEKRHTVRVFAAAGISVRRACELVGTSRTHLGYEAKPKDDAELLVAITEIRRRKPRWGVRRTHRQLRRRGHAVNRKRIERIWREHGLAVPRRRRRRKIRTGAGVPVESGGCGSCHRCVDACPAGAGKDVTWLAGLPREQLYDVKACERETEKHDELGSVCGVCIAVCPVGREVSSPRR